jgi:hypothetical protein
VGSELYCLRSFLFFFKLISQIIVKQRNGLGSLAHVAAVAARDTSSQRQCCISFFLISQHVNPTYRIQNNPTFENTDYTEINVQYRPQRKRRCELLVT